MQAPPCTKFFYILSMLCFIFLFLFLSSKWIYILVCFYLWKEVQYLWQRVPQKFTYSSIISLAIYRKQRKLVSTRRIYRHSEALTLLQFSPSQGHKTSLDKLQCCQTEGYLQHILMLRVPKNYNIGWKYEIESCSVMSSSLGPHGMWPGRLLCSWNVACQVSSAHHIL